GAIGVRTGVNMPLLRARATRCWGGVRLNHNIDGGPEGIRTPDLLNAICRAGVHEGPLGSAPVFDSVRHRPPSSTPIALRPPRAAVKCAVNLSVRDLPDLARHVTMVFDELPSPAPALRGPRAALLRRGAR